MNVLPGGPCALSCAMSSVRLNVSTSVPNRMRRTATCAARPLSRLRKYQTGLNLVSYCCGRCRFCSTGGISWGHFASMLCTAIELGVRALLLAQMHYVPRYMIATLPCKHLRRKYTKRMHLGSTKGTTRAFRMSSSSVFTSTSSASAVFALLAACKSHAESHALILEALKPDLQLARCA